jgi:hypothetical protein
MTPQPPHQSPSAHLGADVLADLDEDLLDASEADLAPHHLAGCAAGRARHAALDDVRGLLRGAAVGTPMPDDVANSLDVALAAARSPATATSAATVTPLSDRRHRVAGTRILQAAAVVLLLALGGLGYAAFLSPNDATSTAGGASDARQEAGAQAGADGGAYPVTASGRDYTSESLAAQVPALVRGLAAAVPKPRAATEDRAGSGGSEPAGSGSASTLTGPGSADGLTGGAPLAACVADLAGEPVTPLAVDVAKYLGRPATIIVLPTAGSRTTVDVYAVAPDCPSQTFLAFRRVARP